MADRVAASQSPPGVAEDSEEALARAVAIKPWLRETTPDYAMWTAQVHQLLVTELVRKLGSALPVEDSETMPSIKKLFLNAETLSDAQNKDDIDHIMTRYEVDKGTLQQLLTALKTSIKSLKTSITRSLADEKKEKAKQDKVAKERQKRLAKDIDELHRTWKEQAANSELFKLDLPAQSTQSLCVALDALFSCSNA